MIHITRNRMGLALLCLFTGFSSAVFADDEAESGLSLEPCVLTLPGTPATAPAECGQLSVPENPADPEGKHISLNIARVPASGRSAEPDPLFLFAGGPGQAATEAWLLVAGALRKVNENRDIILIDQRGTGQSNPLHCPIDDSEDMLLSDWDALERVTRDCLHSLDADPRYYTTTIGMQDYDLVREALGYEQINLWGASYGTRAAQVYMRLFPDRVRSVVLDSVVPQELILGSEHAIKLDKTVFSVLDRCEADPDCARSFPGTSQQLRELIAYLDENTIETTIVHPSTGETMTIPFDRDALAGSLRFLMYSPASQAMVPLLISEAASTGDFGRLAAQMMIATSGIADTIAMGMEKSVTCAEDYPWFPDDDRNAGLLMGNTMIEVTRVQCDVWPKGEVPDDFHDPIVSDTPVLLLSGELDPVTPPEYAEQVAEHLSNSLHVVAPGQGHSVTPHGCLGDMVATFIETTGFDELDTGCVDSMASSPYFMSLTGPRP